MGTKQKKHGRQFRKHAAHSKRNVTQAVTTARVWV